ncbi:MAG: capsular biosynthesis protein [Chloroflexi bacterium]|nr:capsular biosynthesis protein [Chloroflexota bacterium]
MKKILILCHVNPNVSPRPNRMMRWLKDDFDVLIVSPNEAKIEGVRSLVYQTARTNKYIDALLRAALRYFHLLLGRYEEVNWQSLPGARDLIPELVAEKADLIISHDLMLLPLAFLVKTKVAKVMLDAREYYPRNFNDNWFWRMTRRPVNEHLCKTYLKMCNKVITVSPGLAEEYRREFGIEAEVVMSLPARHDLLPSLTQAGAIRMIHHGYANPSRKTELMLELMDYLDDRFTLDLMMMVTDVVYWNKIVDMAKKRANVRIIPPVPMTDIVKTINQYDVGLYLAFPTNFNVAYMLPNKLFEFIQARLAVAIGPSVEMKTIVEKYECGIVSQDFSPQSLAQELNKLDDGKITVLKQKSHQAALALNAEMNGIRIREIVAGLMS